MAAGERGTQRQNREDGKRPLPISRAAFQVDELRQFGVANIRNVENIVDAILGEIADALARYDRVELRGFESGARRARDANC